MTIDVLFSKIHRVTVTGAELNYIGSITVDSVLLKAAKLIDGQKVSIVNINNGDPFNFKSAPNCCRFFVCFFQTCFFVVSFSIFSNSMDGTASGLSL